jgi:hypothetical protein
MDSPYAYHLAWFQRGRYWTGIERDVRLPELAVVRGEYRTPMPGRIGTVFAGAFAPEGSAGAGFVFPFRLPFERTEYYIAADARWQTEFQTVEAETGFFESVHTKPLFSLRRGHRHTELWGSAVHGPAFPEVEGSPSQWVYRHAGGGEESLAGVELAQDSDGIAVSVPVYNDFSEDHEGFSREDSGRTALYVNGELLGEFERSGLGDFGVPDAEATYRLEISGVRPSFAEVSTEVSATWTFRSAHVPDATFTPLPVMAIRFGPALDEHNAARAGRAFALPVWVQRQAGPPAAGLRDLDLDVSYDEGATWQPVPLTRAGDRWLAKLLHPATAGSVSLRAEASDRAGNSVQQTIIRAYRLSPP